MTEEEAAAQREKIWKRKGLILSDEDVVYAMDHSPELSRLSCKKNKNGELSGDIADRDRFKLLKKYVYGVVGSFVDEIASGNVEANPYTRGQDHNPCRYCPYSSVCNPENLPGRRNYKAVDANKFWEDVERSVKEDG